MNGWRDEYADDQFAQAERAGFNPYAPPEGQRMTPPVPDRFGRDEPVEPEPSFDRQWQDIVDRYDEE